jgi:hypothetical protein
VNHDHVERGSRESFDGVWKPTDFRPQAGAEEVVLVRAEYNGAYYVIC